MDRNGMKSLLEQDSTTVIKQYFTVVYFCSYLHIWKGSDRNGEVSKERFTVAHKLFNPCCTTRIYKMWIPLEGQEFSKFF